MKITDTKINGITNPIGFSFPSVKCSWKVTDARGSCQSNVKIMIASDAALENIITVKEGRILGVNLEKNYHFLAFHFKVKSSK